MKGNRMPLLVARHWTRGLCAALGLLCVLLLSANASAAVPTQLWQTPENGESGEGLGQLGNQAGIVADPVSGHVYVSDGGNKRISEFDAWGEFIKSWGWGVADGTAELQTCGPGATPPTITCQAGIAGSGAGQRSKISRGGLALDEAGDVLVYDEGNHRVEKFDSAGHFLLMFGADVNQGPLHPGGICTATHIEEGDICGAGTAGKGDGQLGEPEAFKLGSHLSVGPGGTIFVGGSNGRVQEFESNGAFKSSITLEGQSDDGGYEALSVDQSGNLYVITSADRDHIYKFSPAGALLFTITVRLAAESPLALDATGNIYAVAQQLGSDHKEVVEFDPSGIPITLPGAGFGGQGSDHHVSDLATNTVTAGGGTDIYLKVVSAGSVSFPISIVSAYGPPPDKWAPPLFPPEVLGQYATSVDADRAVVGAEINPRFWADTSYYVEWGTGKCSEGGCVNQQPAPPGAGLVAGVTAGGVPTKGLALTGLQPDTTYHYRFVAQSGGGGPVHGVGEGEAEGAFHTPPLAVPPNTNCPNQIFRTGASAKLTDCRAYEMVTPIEKNNTDIVSLINLNSNPAALNQSAGGGEALTYTTSQGFGDSQGVPYVSQYLASRGAHGWQNHGITPLQGLAVPAISARVDVEFRAFTADLCDSALLHVTDPPLSPGAVEGYTNIYQRHNCAPGADAYEAVTTAKPPNVLPENYAPVLRGLSADGRCTVFSAEDQLTPEAIPGLPGSGSRKQLYESCGGQLRLLSVLPNGQASTVDSAVGSTLGVAGFRSANNATALSKDGSRLYWTESASGPAKLYVRVNAQQEQSAVGGGQCTEEEKACTIRVSQTVSSAPAHFWGASADGSKALFTIEERTSPLNGNLYEFDLESGKSTLIASQVTSMVGVAKEATRAYFVSEEALAGVNSEGESPVAGERNLYFYEKAEGGNSFSFLGTLPPAEERFLSPDSVEPYLKASRLSPDGRHLAFMSSAHLTGYDNTDQASGEADSEVFTYDAETGKLSCVSCNPSGQRPMGRKVALEEFPRTWAAALLPTYENELYGSRVISDDGSRVYFNSYEALLPRDTNGRVDVYEWEAPGSGDCTESAPAYSPPNSGCLSLISSGESPTDSEFVDASADGRDVFFATGSSLLPQDVGLIDIYDAREGGGYPPPATPTPACEGEACQGPLAPPNDPTPGSSSYNGPGNPPLAKKKQKKKARHKKKPAKKHKRAANKSGRAGR